MLRKKRMPTLLEENRKNKRAANLLLSVLSVAYMGLFVNFKDAYMPTGNNNLGRFAGENLCSIDSADSLNKKKSNNNVNPLLSVLSVPYRAYFQKIMVLDPKIGSPYFEPLSVLSVLYKGESVKFKDAKNIGKTPYTPTDNTDSGRFIE
jgi:hypothetical protein